MRLTKLKNPVVYFCSEFAIDNELPTYAGGLGILAGDVMNEAAFDHFPMVGVGILYKGKSYLQHITGEGKAETRDSEFDHDTSFLRQTTVKGKTLVFSLELGTSTVKVKSYHIRLSETSVVFFLSTDIDGNPPEWAMDMTALYQGDADSQLRQQILLGMGGVKLLEHLNINPKIYHLNEGRPGFVIWEIVRSLMEKEKKSFTEAWEEAKKKIVYTNHTLVAAGNLTYSKNILEKWIKPISEIMNVNTDILIKPGLIDENTFSITKFALEASSKHTAVSKIHEKYAKEDWPNYEWIAITNGVHMPRWQDSDYRNTNLSDIDLWNLHMLKKSELMETVVKRTGFGYDPQRLVITWARRLAEYKQPKIIFSDLEKLKNMVSNPEKPVQILFAGNSHTNDPGAKGLIEDIIKIFSTELSGHAIFVPNYNISLANHMTSGSDLWLNTPKGNLEACGTSGMKAISNGVLNCTVLDGWTYEVNWDGIGWVLDPNSTAESFYDILETEIIPEYYNRTEGLPIKWIGRMRKSIVVAKNFSAARMLEEYKRLLY